VKFYLDEDLSGRIAEIARGMGIDIVTASECGNRRSEDEVRLLAAARAGRCLITRNRDHFVALTVRFFQDGLPHAGMLVAPYTFPADRFSAIAAAIAQYDRDHPDPVSPYGFDFLSRPRG
jgi:hypothetical protein